MDSSSVIDFVFEAARLEQLRKSTSDAFALSALIPEDTDASGKHTILALMRAVAAKAMSDSLACHKALVPQVPDVLRWLEQATLGSDVGAPTPGEGAADSERWATKEDLMSLAELLAEKVTARIGTLPRGAAPSEAGGADSGSAARIAEMMLNFDAAAADKIVGSLKDAGASHIVPQKKRGEGISTDEASKLRALLRGGKKDE